MTPLAFFIYSARRGADSVPLGSRRLAWLIPVLAAAILAGCGSADPSPLAALTKQFPLHIEHVYPFHPSIHLSGTYKVYFLEARSPFSSPYVAVLHNVDGTWRLVSEEQISLIAGCMAQVTSGSTTVPLAPFAPGYLLLAGHVQNSATAIAKVTLTVPSIQAKYSASLLPDGFWMFLTPAFSNARYVLQFRSPSGRVLSSCTLP